MPQRTFLEPQGIEYLNPRMDLFLASHDRVHQLPTVSVRPLSPLVSQCSLHEASEEVNIGFQTENSDPGRTCNLPLAVTGTWGTCHSGRYHTGSICQFPHTMVG